MVSKWVKLQPPVYPIYQLVITYNPLILTIDPHFLKHPSGVEAQLNHDQGSEGCWPSHEIWGITAYSPAIGTYGVPISTLGSTKEGSWLVVSNIFYFHPYLGKIPILTNIFQRGWNHQLGSFLSWNSCCWTFCFWIKDSEWQVFFIPKNPFDPSRSIVRLMVVSHPIPRLSPGYRKIGVIPFLGHTVFGSLGSV